MPPTQLSVESLQKKLARFHVSNELYRNNQFIQTLLQLHYKKRVETLRQELADFSQRLLENEEQDHDAEVETLKYAKVVGMTMTGVSINQVLVDQIKPSILIIEEAGEVLETQIIAALSPSVQHLILIGDHKQLRPHANCYKLEKHHNFNISLLERLIRSGHHTVTLTHQSRMLQEIVPLLSCVYNSLKTNLRAIASNKPSTCLAESMFFWTHNETEERIGTSYRNIKEADMLVHVVLWCILQSPDYRVHPSQVTILAMYKAQVDYIRRRLREFCKQHELLVEKLLADDANKQTDHQRAKPIHQRFVGVFSVDQYQGDENDFVFVSLVRSNKDGDMGHVKDKSRMCVSCSRARSGLYLFGNYHFIERYGGSHWQHIVRCFQKREAISYQFPVRCPRHHDCPIPISDYKKLHLDTIEQGSWQPRLCRRTCEQLMPCLEHKCMQTCHPHFGTERCFVKVTKKLPCSHEIECYCWQPERDLECTAQCESQLKCGKHQCPNKCGSWCPSECKECQKFEEECLRLKLQQEQEAIEDETRSLQQRISEGCLMDIPEGDTSSSTRSKLNDIRAVLERYSEVASVAGLSHKLEPIEYKEVASPELRLRFLEKRTTILKAISETKTPLSLKTTEFLTKSQYLAYFPARSAVANSFMKDLVTNGLTKARMPPYGNGIFFKDPPDDRCLCEVASEPTTVMIICEVMLGRCLLSEHLKRKGKQRGKQGYDSVRFQKSQFQIYGIYNTHQVLPVYVVLCNRVPIKVNICCLNFVCFCDSCMVSGC